MKNQREEIDTMECFSTFTIKSIDSVHDLLVAVQKSKKWHIDMVKIEAQFKMENYMWSGLGKNGTMRVLECSSTHLEASSKQQQNNVWKITRDGWCIHSHQWHFK